eukprot:COSAG01_NODE_2518_length_7524_cov_2.305724_11_plen_67_part_00
MSRLFLVLTKLMLARQLGGAVPSAAAAGQAVRAQAVAHREGVRIGGVVGPRQPREQAQRARALRYY